MPVHKCHKCALVCRSPSDLEKHLNRKIPCDAGKYPCDGCGNRFMSKKAVKRHLENGSCKGREPDAEELQQENQELQDRLHNMEEQMGMVNKASAAVVQNIVLNNTNNLVINVENLNVHNSAGQEDLSHISKLTFQELQKKLSLPHTPQAFAEWCKMVRTDEDHPENHTALLLDKDATEMACCMDGEWKLDDRKKHMFALLCQDSLKMYNSLNKHSDHAAVNDFRFNYLVHDIMQKTGAMDMVALQPVMDAMAEPIVAMTRKLYARAEPLANSSVSSAQFDQLNQAVQETQQAVMRIQAQLALYQQGTLNA